MNVFKVVIIFLLLCSGISFVLAGFLANSVEDVPIGLAFFGGGIFGLTSLTMFLKADEWF